jgi:hypothetical protein
MFFSSTKSKRTIIIIGCSSRIANAIIFLAEDCGEFVACDAGKESSVRQRPVEYDDRQRPLLFFPDVIGRAPPRNQALNWFFFGVRLPFDSDRLVFKR